MRGVIKNILYTPRARERAHGRRPHGPDGRYARGASTALSQVQPLVPHCAASLAHGTRWGDGTAGAILSGRRYPTQVSSVFVKPAKSGAATPWHQDNGLWRDGETEPFNFWMALDPAKRENGCLQFIPGSHKTEIVEHVLYADSIHGELPRERVAP